MGVSSLRKGMTVLRNTPFHPQWFVTKGKDRRLRHLGRLEGDVLDIGCTDKALAGHLPQGCRYVGLDYYATVQSFYSTRPDVYGDACRLPLAGRSMDGILLFEVLEHVPDPEAALAELSRVLKPRGLLLLSVPFIYPVHNAPFDFHRFTRHALERSLQRHGFEVESIEPRLRSIEVGGLMTSLALGDAARRIGTSFRWAFPFLIPIGVGVLLVNVTAWALSRLLPGSDFMPEGYDVVAVRRT